MVLYAHEPRSLLPLLEGYLPHSICIVGAIHTTLATSNPLQQVYTSFPPSDVSSPPSLWVAAVALPWPATQIRVFHILEADPRPKREDVEAGGRAVANAIEDLHIRHPQHTVLGAIHLHWCDAVRNLTGCRPGTDTDTYLAPLQLPSPPPADTTGLTLDHGREGDEHLVSYEEWPSQLQIYSKNNYRSPAYYASRALDTTVYRTEGGTLAAWIITNLDGSLGALYTMPEYRRRGLARALVAEHLKKHARDVRGFCHIERGNTASEKMWSALGWKPEWAVQWLRWAQE